MPRLPHFSPRRDAVTIRGYSKTVRDAADDMDIRRVVSSLCFGHLDPAGAEITDIGNFRGRLTVRLDRQSNTSDGNANLQVQVNDSALERIRLGRHDGTTIAQVLVPAAVFATAFHCPEHNIRTHLESVARSALIQSSNSFGFQFTVVED